MEMCSWSYKLPVQNLHSHIRLMTFNAVASRPSAAQDRSLCVCVCVCVCSRRHVRGVINSFVDLRSQPCQNRYNTIARYECAPRDCLCDYMRVCKSSNVFTHDFVFAFTAIQSLDESC